MIASPLIAVGGLLARRRRCGPPRCRRAAGARCCGRRRRSIAYALSRPVPTRGAVARRGRPRLPARGGAQDLALLRDVRRRRGSLRCRRTTSRSSPELTRRAPHVADQHRHGAARDAGRARPRVHRHRRAGRRGSTRRSTTIEGLERYEGHLLNWYDTRTLAPLPPALRLDGRQRQPRRRADDARRSALRRRTCGLDRRSRARAAARCSTR